jgi:hypothetical protein
LSSHPVLLTTGRPERLEYENPGVHTLHVLNSRQYVLRRIEDREYMLYLCEYMRGDGEVDCWWVKSLVRKRWIKRDIFVLPHYLNINDRPIAYMLNKMVYTQRRKHSVHILKKNFDVNILIILKKFSIPNSKIHSG